MRFGRVEFLVSLFLIVATLGVFCRVASHDFVNYDDSTYVTKNRHVQAGLTWKGVVWSFTATRASNWHPITWLCHMLDWEFYGANPTGHHLASLVFHLANTLLLFSVLTKMTGALWQSAFVAAVFALHPLHVESVAWVSERKDVLSTFFWMATMWAYVRYVMDPRRAKYVLTVFFFTLGLMSKPMLVTLPFVLLMTDYWPLGRLHWGQVGDHPHSKDRQSIDAGEQRSRALHLVWEKAPFFALAAVSSVVTFFVQQSGEAVQSFTLFPFEVRVANALVAYVEYLGKTLWPQNLAVFYPHPGHVPSWKAAGAGLFLVVISVWVIRVVRQQPYLAFGWLWYLGTLVPVIGLVQVGAQSMADRYTYVPVIGVLIAIAWGIPNLLAGWHYRRVFIATSTGAVLFALIICTWQQVGHWHDSTTLFKHAIKVTDENPLAHFGLGRAFEDQGKTDMAISHYSEALRIKPDFAMAHDNWGVALARKGRLTEAIVHFSEALLINANLANPHYNLGFTLHMQGKLEKAVAHYSEALRIDPDHANAHNNLGLALTRLGKLDEAITHYYEALRIQPEFPQARHNLERALRRVGKSDLILGLPASH